MHVVPDRAAARSGSRVAAAVIALPWATLFFGVIDLTVVWDEDPRFFTFRVLETGWGLLFTFLVPGPLLAWAARPQRWSGIQLLAVAAAVLIAGLLGLALGQVVVALLVACSAGICLSERPSWVRSALRPVAPADYWPLGLLVLSALMAAAWCGWRLLAAAREGVKDDDTWGLMHLPMQCAFGLAVALSAAVASLAPAGRTRSSLLPFLPASMSAGWFGAVAMAHPSHLGSVGRVGGLLAIGWAVLLLLTAWATSALDHRRRFDASGSADDASSGQQEPRT